MMGLVFASLKNGLAQANPPVPQEIPRPHPIYKAACLHPPCQLLDWGGGRLYSRRTKGEFDVFPALVARS
jgi:hypothetical protein